MTLQRAVHACIRWDRKGEYSDLYPNMIATPVLLLSDYHRRAHLNLNLNLTRLQWYIRAAPSRQWNCSTVTRVND